jgi:D-psicose/D-tagatose/L-ribulose 3-epimerase
MKLGLNMLLWTTQVGPEHFPLFEALKVMGYDGVELPLFSRDDDLYRQVCAELDRTGLQCTAVSVATSEANPISPEPAVRRAALDMIKERIDTVHLLGGDILCGPLHSALGQFVGRRRTQHEWNWCVETLRSAAEFADQAGVTVAIEPLNRFECYFLNTASDTRKLVDAVGHPNIRAMYDTFHSNIEERSVQGAIEELAPVLAHVHISENHRGTPGEGLVRWDETFTTLRHVGYDGWLTIESFGPSLPDLSAMCIWRELFDSEMGLAERGLKFMKDHWDSM